MNDLISVIITVYNVEKYIVRCVESILNQTYKNIEVILVDDGSTDDSKRVCKRLEKRDKRIIFFSKENGGVSSARNYGIKRANGDYIAFVDADDWVAENYCQNLIGEMHKRPVDMVVFGLTRKSKMESHIIKHNIRNGYYKHKDMEKIVIDDGSLSGFTLTSPCDVLYKTEIIKNNNVLFDERIGINEDGLFNVKYFMSCTKGLYINYNKSFYYYRLNNQSASRTVNLLSDYYNSNMIAIEDCLNELAYSKKYNVNSINKQIQMRRVTICFNQVRYILSNKRNLKDIKKVCQNKNLTEGLSYIKINQLKWKKRPFYYLIKFLS